jgi:hypothetical protein
VKKKLRRQLKDSYQIGNYIYANRTGITVVVSSNERVTNEKITSDINNLLKFWGAEYVDFYIAAINELLG